MFLINIPHNSLYIPNKAKKDYIINEKELIEIVKNFSDYKTKKLYKNLFKNHVVMEHKYSRIFIDIERFELDKLEPQSKYGMGWFYTHSPFENKQIRIKKNKLKYLKIYKNFHNKFEQLVEKEIKKNNIVRIIDCHSFSSDNLYFQDINEKKPDICIGYDKYHKDEELINRIKDVFKDYYVKENIPYSGSIVPNSFYQKNKNVKSTMIEINKQLYMNEKTFHIKKKEFKKIQKLLGNLICEN